MHVKQNQNQQPTNTKNISKNNNKTTKQTEICSPKNTHSIASDENDKMQNDMNETNEKEEKKYFCYAVCIAAMYAPLIFIC